MSRISVLVVACMLLFASCNKVSVNDFEGDYSFKISGNVVLSTGSEDINEVLTAESGQMSIKRIEGDSVMVVMNIMNGDVLITTGVVDDNSLVLNSFERSLKRETSVLNGVVSNSYQCTVTVDGEGTLYDDMLVFDLEYVGSGTYKEGINNEVDVDVTGDNVKMAAFKND